jgi:hypothetical protein
MTSKFHLFAAALAGILVFSPAGAQNHTASSPARGSSVQARPARRAPANFASPSTTALQTRPHAARSQILPSGRFSSDFASDENLTSFHGISGVPGLGFDFPHLAAINGGWRFNSEQFGHHGHRVRESFVPIFFGGYAYAYDDLSSDQQDQQDDQLNVQQSQPQPQNPLIQQSVPDQQGADAGADRGNLSASVSEPQADVPIPDVGNFIFVRRDGRVLFASVFSVVGSQLQYVSPEGIRRTLAMSDVDTDATQQMNEARGTTVQFHN